MKSFTQSLIVDMSHTASVWGSGFLDVYATPAMVAFMENTAALVITDLETGYTTVGTEINVKHLKAVKVGEKVTCTATLVNKDRRLYSFQISVEDSTGDVIGEAIHTRAAVDIERFMKKLEDRK